MSPPFLSAPYAGYAEIASYFDHDSPNYAVDGKIILADGLTVTGTASPYSFPSYWSPKLRQYISYDGHNGYDYDIAYQPVLAAATGTVAYAAWESTDPYYGYGQMILIKHVDGYETLYGHLSKILVHPGEKVTQGQQIAISGDTGHSTGPHLHFSVYHNCHIMDPYGWSGPGNDPLVSFNGETSTYLWEDGKAPLVLNPLPDWPTFQSTLNKHAPPPVLLGLPSVGLPTLSHLLLLKLPVISPTSPDTALAAFQSQLADEQRTLVQLLTQLENDGSIQSFEVLADEGAIETTGTLPANQLLSLPGVASLTGARPKDLQRAQLGLDLALLSAIQQPRLLTYFPSTYLDAQWLWRPTVSVQINGSVVLGFTQPAENVRVVVLHNNRPVAWGTARGSATSGAFLTTVTNGYSQDVRVRQGESVQVSSDGRQTTVSALPLSLWSNPAKGNMAGSAPKGAHVTAAAIGSVGSTQAWTALAVSKAAAADPDQFSLGIGSRLQPGDPVSARVVDSSGNTITTWIRVHGFIATEGSAQVDGWTGVGSVWHIAAFAENHRQSSGQAEAGADGFIQITMFAHHGVRYALRPQEVLRFSRDSQVFWMRLPVLSGSLGNGGKTFSGSAPAGSQLIGQVWNDAQGTWTTLNTRTTKAGVYHLDLPKGSSGSSVDVLYRSNSGNLVRQTWADRAIVVHDNEGLVTGHAGLGQTLVLHAYGPDGHLLGAGTAATSPRSGAFTSLLLSRQAGSVRLHVGDTITISDGEVVSAYGVPQLIVKELPDLQFKGWTSKPNAPAAALVSTKGQIGSLHVSSLGNYFTTSVSNPLALPSDSSVQFIDGSSSAVQAEVDIPIATPIMVGKDAVLVAASLGRLPNAAS